MRLADEPHHDGSPDHVEAADRSLGATVRVRLRVPARCGTTRVRLRSTPDAEPAVVEAVLERHGAGAAWWAADLLLHNPVTRYRWLLDGGTLGRCWVNGAGLFRRDVTDDADFRITTAPPAPAWLAGTVGYQVFIDRFASSAAGRPTPDWAIPRRWDEPIVDVRGLRSRHWYGGDLLGVEEHLDHIADLGVTLLYLTPFFPAGSMHRYDATTFRHVDPALGGDEALQALTAAAHARGIRVIGDITLNHTGVRHEWFTAAATDADAPERAFYFFDPDLPQGYVAWHGVPSLPKLDHRSPGLGEQLLDGERSVIGRYLGAPFGLDGWRVDCANTTARWRDHDDTHDVARRARATMDRRTDGQAWLVAEHCYDAVDDLDGTGWHGVMAYQWFTRPLWGWLKEPGDRTAMAAVELIDLDGPAMVESMRHLAANVSWDARGASMTMLDSHDTARFRTVVGDDAARHLVGLAALFTMPGVPTLFAGDEVGCTGDSMDTARVPFPWQRLADPDEVTTRLVDAIRTLSDLHTRSTALQRGSLRWLDAAPDSVTYLRSSGDERVLVHLVRHPTGSTTITLDDLDLGSDTAPPDVLAFGDAVGDGVGIGHRSVVMPGAPGATVLHWKAPPEQAPARPT
jgi:alpha-glucosidase